MKAITALTASILLVTLISIGASGVFAQRFPRQLEDIRMYGKGEMIEFVFSQPYEGKPIEEYRPGVFSLSFGGTGSDKPVRGLRPVEESLYKKIEVVQNRYSTTVTFFLKDQKLNLKQKLNFTREPKILKVRLNAPFSTNAAAVQQIKEGRDLLREMESRIGGKTTQSGEQGPLAKPDGPPVQEGNLALSGLEKGPFFISLVTMVIALAVIIAGLYGVLFVYNRFFATRLGRLTGGHSIKQVASFHIGPRQRVVVLDINGETVACGVTPNQITYITHLGGQGHLAGKGGEKAVSGAAALARGEAKPSAENGDAAKGLAKPNSPKGDSVHQFAEVLKQKVRSLKRIN